MDEVAAKVLLRQSQNCELQSGSRCGHHSLDLHEWRGRGSFTEHIARRDSRSGEGLFAVGGGRPAHIAFHISESRAARTGTDVTALGAAVQIAGSNRADLLQLA